MLNSLQNYRPDAPKKRKKEEKSIRNPKTEKHPDLKVITPFSNHRPSLSSTFSGSTLLTQLLDILPAVSNMI